MGKKRKGDCGGWAFETVARRLVENPGEGDEMRRGIGKNGGAKGRGYDLARLLFFFFIRQDESQHPMPETRMRKYEMVIRAV
jgi:hypothetical protein